MGVRVSASRHGGVVRARNWGPLVGALLALAALPATPALSKPTRVVSMNLCADQLLLLLADRAHIASIGYLAVDANASAMAEAARGLDINHGLAEEIIPLEPDLVLAGSLTTRPTVFLLRRLGYRVVELPVASTFDDIRANIRTVAEAIGERERGESIVASFDRNLASTTDSDGSRNPVAALYWANGYSSGRGTLADVVARAAGFRNLASELGLAGTAQLPLETLLASKPDVLIVGRQRGGAAMAHEHLRHPAFRKAFADHPTVTLPNRLWVCGTPFVAEAVNRLRALRDGGSAVRQSGGER